MLLSQFRFGLAVFVSLLVGVAAGWFYINSHANAQPKSSTVGSVNAPVVVSVQTAPNPITNDTIEFAKSVDPRKLIQDIGKPKDRAQLAMLMLALAKLGADSPREAEKLAKQLFEEKSDRAQLVKRYIWEAYGEKHREVALQTIKIETPDAPVEAAYALAGWAAKSLDEAESYLFSNAREPHLRAWEVLGAMAQESLDQRGSSNALEWINRFPDKRDSVIAIHEMVKAITSSDRKAAESLLNSVSGRDEARYAVGQYASAYASVSPESAMNWAMSLRTQARGSAIAEVAAGWAKADVLDAMTWLVQSPPDVGVLAARPIVLNLANDDLTLAVVTANLVGSNEQKDSLVANILLGVPPKRFKELEKLLDRAEVSESQRRMIRKKLNIRD